MPNERKCQRYMYYQTYCLSRMCAEQRKDIQKRKVQFKALNYHGNDKQRKRFSTL